MSRYSWICPWTPSLNVSLAENPLHTRSLIKERLKGTPDKVFGHDDTVTFNTQSGSQWDGLRHIAVQHCGKYYNALEHRTIDEEKENGRLGIHSMDVSLPKMTGIGC